MNLIFGILLGFGYLLIGWLLIEIPFALMTALYNKIKYGIFDVEIAGPIGTIFMSIFEIIIISIAFFLIGLNIEIILVAAGIRIMLIFIIG